MDSKLILLFTLIWVRESAIIKDEIKNSSCNRPRMFDVFQSDSQLPRVQSYCNPFTNITLKDENNNKLEFIKGLKLSRVFILTRHGDRAPFKSIINISSINVDPFLTQKTNIQSFIKKFFIDTKFRFSKMNALEDKSLYERASSNRLERGHLTKYGFVQQLTLGSIMGEYYGKKLRISPDQIKAYSSRTPRTYQSALAFLYGFLKPETDNDFSQFPGVAMINSTSIMVGAFLCYGCSEKCPIYNQLNEIIHDHFSAYKKNTVKIMSKTISILTNNQAEAKKYHTPFHVFDALSAYLCHNHPLPSTTDKCVTLEDAKQLKYSIDLGMKKLTDIQEFQQLSMLQVYVFLNTLIRHMSDTQRKAKLTLYSAHDITLQSVAIALEFFDGNIPPYSSRIVFESYVYENQNKNNIFVRIIFNGKDVTHLTGVCKSNLCLSHGLKEQVYLININDFRDYILGKFKYYFNTNEQAKACYSQLNSI